MSTDELPDLNSQSIPSPKVAGLRKLWEEAINDDSPGVPADEVLDSLERKYQAMLR